MPIVEGDIQNRFSGGASNNDPNASLGGVKSSNQIQNATVANLFANVSGAEAAAGSVKYRCYYRHNAHATLVWQSVVVWIEQNTPSTDTAVAIGLDPAGIGDGSTTGVATTVVDEDTAPAGVTFTTPSDKGSGLAVGNVSAGQGYAVWVRWTVNAGASAYNEDNTLIRAEGETGA